MSKSFKELSRDSWCIPDSLANQRPTLEQVQFGVLQRIADATETMAKPYNDLRARYDAVCSAKQRLEDDCARAIRKINALKGVITKMKNTVPGCNVPGKK